MRDEKRVVRLSIPMIREVLKSERREWSALEIAERFGVLEKSVKTGVPEWIGAVSGVRVLRTPRGWFRGLRYETPTFVEQTGPSVEMLLDRVAELEAEVARLKKTAT